MSTAASPERRLAGFLARYAPEVRAVARGVLSRLRARLPGFHRLVYDNYNALAIGFAPTERASDALISIALYPRWVTLFFLRGVELSDPRGLLKGSGSSVRHVVLGAAADLDQPAVRALIGQALRRSPVPAASRGRGRLVIKSVSARQRPRQPPGSSSRKA